MGRHNHLERIASTLYRVPGSKLITREISRFVIQNSPLSFKNKQRLYNFISKDTIPRVPVMYNVKPFLGRSIKLRLNLQDDLSRMWYYWGYEGYERGTTKLLIKLLKTKRCVFDIGANVGYYSLLIASLLEGKGEVYVFEPWPDVFRWLLGNSEFMDVEGAEIKVLQGLGRFLNEWYPDLICEILDPYARELDAFFKKLSYRKFLITDNGLVEKNYIYAHPQFRDYYLSCNPVSFL